MNANSHSTRLGDRSPAKAVSDLLRSFDLQRVSAAEFLGPPAPNNRGRAFGGHVIAQSLIAATHTIDDGFAVHSVHSHFLHAANSNLPILYEVASLRNSRSFQTRQVTAQQNGRDIFLLTASFQQPERGYEHQIPMPTVPAPEGGLDLLSRYAEGGYAEGEEVAREWAAVTIRHLGSTSDGLQLDPSQPSQQRAWFKFAAALPSDPHVHVAAFAWSSDITLLPASLAAHTVQTEGMQIASLDHTIWFHRPLKADEWWLYDQESPSAENGRGLSFGKVFDSQGRLVATTAQQGVIRPAHGAGI